MLDAIALGELLIDFATVDTDRDGYPTLAAHPGGAPGNFLAALHAYGCSGAMLGKVGADTFGTLLCATLAQAGIRTEGIVRDPAVFTTLAFVTFGPGGERACSFARKPGADTQLRFDELELSLLDEARLLHFGSLSLTQEPVRSATQQAAAYAAAHGKLLSFDPNLRLPLWPDADAAKTQILWGLRQADIVKISDDEVRFLWGCSPEEGAARLLADFGVRLAMVTCGPKGCLLQNAGAAVRVAAPRVLPVDTTGAGDIFGGSAVSRLLQLGRAPEALTEDELTALIMSLMSNGTRSFDANLSKLGYAELSKPSQIDIYPDNFEDKQQVIAILDDYNDRMVASGQDDKKVSYTDFVGTLMKSVTTIVDMISYVLIAFVAISLVVSSIMIGIITYISVLERKKEIGILRAIGASKGDISRVFNAETITEGLTAGRFGVGVVALVCIPVNAIVYGLLDVPDIAMLPPVAGAILVAISVFLSFVAGLFPAMAAARKDPVEALRAE